MPRHYAVRTSSTTVGEGFDALSQERRPIVSAIPRIIIERKRGRIPAHRPVSSATALGCLLIATGALLGCCLLAGVVGLAIAGAVLVAIAACACHALVRLGPRGNGTPPSTTRSFWGSLDDAEREAFVSMARERSFARGAALFREGETADHVILIRSGRTQICVGEGRTKWVIAERGPGQLIGERAALQVNLRSASVIALETVRAYVVRTEDFAEFVGAHPRVLGIVEGQVYERLTTPMNLAHDEWPPSADERPAGSRGEPFHGENCTIVFTDVAGFAADVRNDEDRRIVRQELFGMTRAAFDDAGIPWDSCRWDDRGDGLLIVVPPDIPTTNILDGLPARLAEALKRHNRRSSDAVRIQLRLAVHVGPVVTDIMGLSGEAIICAARLLDAPVLKRGLAETAANLGVIVSTFVWESVVRHSDADGFRQVRVEVKESSLDAWMRLSGRSLTS